MASGGCSEAEAEPKKERASRRQRGVRRISKGPAVVEKVGERLRQGIDTVIDLDGQTVPVFRQVCGRGVQGPGFFVQRGQVFQRYDHIGVGQIGDLGVQAVIFFPDSSAAVVEVDPNGERVVLPVQAGAGDLVLGRGVREIVHIKPQGVQIGDGGLFQVGEIQHDGAHQKVTSCKAE